MSTDVEATCEDSEDDALPTPNGQKRIRFNIRRVKPQANGKN